jgi:hypothetical protein
LAHAVGRRGSLGNFFGGVVAFAAFFFPATLILCVGLVAFIGSKWTSLNPPFWTSFERASTLRTLYEGFQDLNGTA